MEARISHKKLKTLLDYDAVSGLFTWKSTRCGRALAGNVAGTDSGQGYTRIGVGGRFYKAHHLAWFYIHAVWPTQIDHIDLDKSNNAISNLREANNSQNKMNSPVYSSSTTGFKGVTKMPSGSWLVRVGHNKKRITVGTFKTLEHAVVARDIYARRLHGEFFRSC